MLKLNEFKLSEDLIDLSGIEIEGEMYLIQLKRPWSTYICADSMSCSVIDDVCICTALDFSKTYIFVFCGEDVHTVHLPLTEIDRQVLGFAVENAYD